MNGGRVGTRETVGGKMRRKTRVIREESLENSHVLVNFEQLAARPSSPRFLPFSFVHDVQLRPPSCYFTLISRILALVHKQESFRLSVLPFLFFRSHVCYGFHFYLPHIFPSSRDSMTRSVITYVIEACVQCRILLI